MGYRREIMCGRSIEWRQYQYQPIPLWKHTEGGSWCGL